MSETTTFYLNYDSQPLAEVEIDPVPAAPAIKEMVEFWMDWESDLARNDGNYTTTFLKNLSFFMLKQSRVPKDDEGWVRLDGTHGITVRNFYRYDFDEDLIEIS